MKLNKEEMIHRAKEPTTWLGIAGIIVAGFGLAPESAEQISVLIGSIIAMLIPHAKKK